MFWAAVTFMTCGCLSKPGGGQDANSGKSRRMKMRLGETLANGFTIDTTIEPLRHGPLLSSFTTRTTWMLLNGSTRCGMSFVSSDKFNANELERSEGIQAMDKNYKRMTDFLVNLGIEQVSHTTKSYLGHLVGLHRLMEARGCTEE